MYRRYYDSGKQENGAVPMKRQNIFASIKGEDILLLGIIFVLMQEGKGDKMLILALWFIFISGF